MRYDTASMAKRAASLTQLSTSERQLLKEIDLAGLEARLHAADMIALLVGFAKDPTLSAETRRPCANDVLDRAYGRPVSGDWQRVVPVAAVVAQGGDVVARIAAAAAAANEMVEMDRYLGKVPSDQWPPWLVERIGPAGVEAFKEIAREMVRSNARPAI